MYYWCLHSVYLTMWFVQGYTAMHLAALEFSCKDDPGHRKWLQVVERLLFCGADQSATDVKVTL